MTLQRKPSRLVAVTAAVLATSVMASVVSGCSKPVENGGQAKSSLFNPANVGGLPVVDGPSGVRADAPDPDGEVVYGDDSDADRLGMLSVNDVVEYWEQHYTDPMAGSFEPVENIASYDSTNPIGPRLCGSDWFRKPNAFFCPGADMIAWDRGNLVPTGIEYFGDVSIAALLAHEYGHAVQTMGDLVDRSTPVIVREQQADCFAGNYIRWVAEGKSSRFEMNTSDGLNRVLAAVITIRDPILTPEDEEMVHEGHGNALDRISAFQTGFIDGVAACAAIDLAQIEASRGDMPMILEDEQDQGGEAPINEKLVQMITEVVAGIYGLDPAPAVTLDANAPACPDVKATPPVSYCPSSNTIAVDLPGLQALGSQAGSKERVLVQGDNTAISVLTSRLALALQHNRGVNLTDAAAAVRTACLTGVAQRKMVEPIDAPSGGNIVLTAGDFDEAVAGLLNNGMASAGVDGNTVPAGFTRIMAYRSGIIDPDIDACFTRFP